MLYEVITRFDLSRGFPLMTTKKVHTKSVIHELLWFLAGAASGEVARVVLDPGAVAHLAQHLDVEQRPLLQPMGLEHAPVVPQHRQAPLELLLDRPDGLLDLLAGRDEELRRIDSYNFV